MEYNLVIIGAGWAGFNAAIRAKEFGLKTCLIEKREIGGTCLNYGCIPTKSLIHSAEILEQARQSAHLGVNTGAVSFDFIKAQQRKTEVISQLRSGMSFLLKGIDIISSEAELISPDEIKTPAQNIKAGVIIIASGSMASELPRIKFDGKKVISSNELLNLQKIPQNLLVIGGGVIGCEFAGLFNALGAKVTIIEKMTQLIPGLDAQIAKKLESIFKKQGITVKTGSEASSADIENHELTLLAVGRQPDTSGMGLEKAGVNTDKARIITDEYLRTNIKNIYACGDCTSEIMLAHFAAYQGEIAAYNCVNPLASKKATNSCVPSCIFTQPQIATVGLSEEAARTQGLSIDIYRFDFLSSGMARIICETDGFIKIICDDKSGRIIGASIIGPKATELIGVLAVAINNSLTLSAIKSTIFAHPTIAESIREVKKQ